MCLKLLEVCLKQLNFRHQIEVICNLVKLLLTSIQRQRQEKVKRADNMERQGKEEEIINNMLKILRGKLMNELPPTMSNNYQSESFLRELRVCMTINIIKQAIKYTVNKQPEQTNM